MERSISAWTELSSITKIFSRFSISLPLTKSCQRRRAPPGGRFVSIITNVSSNRKHILSGFVFFFAPAQSPKCRKGGAPFPLLCSHGLVVEYPGPVPLENAQKLPGAEPVLPAAMGSPFSGPYSRLCSCHKTARRTGAFHPPGAPDPADFAEPGFFREDRFGIEFPARTQYAIAGACGSPLSGALTKRRNWHEL